jgi:hypothetical protein
MGRVQLFVLEILKLFLFLVKKGVFEEEVRGYFRDVDQCFEDDASFGGYLSS